MNDIIEVFISYLNQYKSVDIAESQFKKDIHVDAELRQAYRNWCEEVGSSEKDGFADYCEEYLESQDDIWNSLNDYNDE